MKITNEKVVSMHYTLTNDAGQVLDSSDGRDPLVYLHGFGNIIPGLEDALVDKETGEKLEVVVAPDQGYGKRNEEMVQQVELARFEKPDEIKPGVQIQVQSDQGTQLGIITQVGDGTATLDLNHPLADETLHFAVEIMEVRDASADEISHGHVHGVGGHQH